MLARAAELIHALDLSPHPEGGYFREVHRSTTSVEPRDGRTARSALTTIYFLLVSGEVSRWHRVASDEAWHFLEGDALALHVAEAGFDRVVTHLLGPHGDGAEPVHVVAAGFWQAARSAGDFTLVGCTVGPGFDFGDFELLHEVASEAEALRVKQPRFTGFL